MTIEFRTHRRWHTFSTIHQRVALVLVVLLLIPVVTGARPWRPDCPGLTASAAPPTTSPGQESPVN